MSRFLYHENKWLFTEQELKRNDDFFSIPSSPKSSDYQQLSNLPSTTLLQQHRHSTIPASSSSTTSGPTTTLSTLKEKSGIKLRKDLCLHIQNVGMKLKYPQLTIATAIVFVHRFYARQSLKQYHRTEDIATAALFLAGKVEETPKKIKDIIQTIGQVDSQRVIPEDSQEFNFIRDRILRNERLLLETLCFDLKVDHPYSYLIQYIGKIKGPKPLAHTSWCFLNDSYFLPLCLLYPPDKIAAAAALIAAKALKLNFETPELKSVWEHIFLKDHEMIHEISKQLLGLYFNEGDDYLGEKIEEKLAENINTEREKNEEKGNTKLSGKMKEEGKKRDRDTNTNERDENLLNKEKRSD